jgi:hypothetical protein
MTARRVAVAIGQTGRGDFRHNLHLAFVENPDVRLVAVADPPDVRGLDRHPVAAAIRASAAVERGAWSGFFGAQIYRDVAEYVVEGVEPETSGRRNLETMRFVDAVQRSTEEGRPITLA